MKEKPDTTVLSGHRKRLRGRLECDSQAVADYEILELLLGLALTRKDTKLLAHALLKRFSSIRGVLDARPDELAQIDGFGPALQSLWRLIREVMFRYASSALLQRETLASPEEVARVLRQRLGNLPHEESWLALVDVQNRLIALERLRSGGINSISLQPRDIFELALKRKASGIILAHNHPGGSPSPSSADKQLTAEIEKLAPLLGFRFLDHIIVTAGDCYSLCARRIIRPTEVK